MEKELQESLRAQVDAGFGRKEIIANLKAEGYGEGEILQAMKGVPSIRLGRYSTMLKLVLIFAVAISLLAFILSKCKSDRERALEKLQEMEPLPFTPHEMVFDSAALKKIRGDRP